MLSVCICAFSASAANEGPYVYEIKDGGVSYIRVTDDGKGIPAQDVKTAFLRHATSKISRASDLDNISTMGFRGEALAALSAVARVDMFTRTRSSDEGRHICIEGGEITEDSETGCPVGTNIVVRDLFYNVPARSKFMKKDATEAARIEEAVTNAAIAKPGIAFKLIKDGRDRFSTSGNGSLNDVMYSFVGKDVVDDLILMATEISGVKIFGYISHPSLSRATRSMQGFFINGRPVRSKVLTAAVDEAYKGRLMVGRQPVYYILLDIHPSQLDVNVHPAKLEVKFAREREVFLAVRNGVSAVLDGIDVKRTKELNELRKLEKEEAKATLAGYGNADLTIRDTYVTDLDNTPKSKVASTNYSEYKYTTYDYSKPETDTEPEKAAETVPKIKPADSLLKKCRDIPVAGYLFSPLDSQIPVQQQIIPDFSKAANAPASDVEESIICDKLNLKIIGEVFHTYIVVETDKSMWLIDKHAAHERQIYNQLKASGIEGMAQYLFTPQIVVLSRLEKQAVLDNEELLRSIGFDTGDFGGLSVIVRSAPNYIDHDDITAVLSELAGKIMEHRSADIDIFDALIKSVACKSAIKAGMNTNIRELIKLAQAVLTSPDLQCCPHGRPTAIELTQQQIEKMFKRIV
ncbi:MAG: DNA mismatch repair endonuclease MutL [Clostridia bacterium]|nr:DNA mismatch repair endonuclease MutL [Clostridia bacterium]